MPKFKYTAVGQGGQNIEGVITSTNEALALSTLRGEGYFPTKIAEVKEFQLFKPKVKPLGLGPFCGQMAAMLRAGVPITKTLEILRDQTDDKALRKILPEVYVEVQRGSSVSNAIKPFASSFPSFFYNMVEAGEASGSLDMTIERAGISFTKLSKINMKVKNAMIYPIILLVVMFALLVVMLAFVVPQFAMMFEGFGAELPLITRVVMGLSDFVVGNIIIILPLLIGAIGGFTYWKKTDPGMLFMGNLILNLPKVNKLIAKVYAARFARTLSSLSLAGVSLPDALRITAKSVENRKIELELNKVNENILKGEPLSEQLERMGLFPPMISYVCKIGEESGQLDSLLNQTADFYDDESEMAVQGLLAMMEPMLILMLAAVVIPVLLAVMLPMFQMYQHML